MALLHKWSLPLGFVVGVLAWPVGVAAEARPTLIADHPPSRRGDSAVELEVGWWTNSDDAGTTIHVFAPWIGFRHAFSDSAQLEVDWPFVFIDVSPEDSTGDSAFRSGNPLIAGYYTGEIDGGYFRVGGGFAPPLVDLDISDPDLAIEVLAFTTAMAIRGVWDIWHFAPDHFTLAFPVQVEARDGSLVAGGDFALAYMISADDQVSGDDDIAVQMAGMVGYRTDKTTLGGRLQLVWIPSGDSSASTGSADNAQLSLVPFVQSDASGFFYAKILLNLDEPFGVFGDADVWGLFLGGGGRY